MIKKISWMILTVFAFSVTSPLMAEMTPVGETMIAVRLAKAAKKHKEKKEEEEAHKQKLDKLRQRYPQDVAEYEKLLKDDQDAAKRKFAAMVTKYKADTGEDLDKAYAVKKTEGPIQRIKENISGEKNSSDSSSDSSDTHRHGLLSRIMGN